MSISLNITAFRDMDVAFKRMFEAKKWCDEHGFSYPQEVTDYFGDYTDEDEEGLREVFLTIDIDKAVTAFKTESCEGWDIDIRLLPAEVSSIRVEECF